MVMLNSRFSYGVLAGWVVALGIFLVLAPADWFGPSWSYFYSHGQVIVPAGGFGMGVCCICLGIAQWLALWGKAARLLAVLLFLSGFVFWTAGLLLGAEGLFGHQGLIESPFMLFVGAHKFVMGANLYTQPRRLL